MGFKGKTSDSRVRHSEVLLVEKYNAELCDHFASAISEGVLANAKKLTVSTEPDTG